MLSERKKSILETLVQEYITTAQPVASKSLAKRYNFGVGPATIRNEMNELGELGYLEQPHTSAGRVPTDIGYRFFVDSMSGALELRDFESQLLDDVFELDQEEEFLREFGQTIAKLSRSFTAVGFSEEPVLYETGLSRILGEPEFQDLESVRGLGRLIDFLGSGWDDIVEYLDDVDERILIGEENPLKAARAYTMFFSSWKHPRGFGGFLTMVGPRRTDYRKNKAIMKSIRRFQYE